MAGRRGRFRHVTPIVMPKLVAPTPKAAPKINLPSVANITIGDKTFDCSVEDLRMEDELGRGAYGHVSKMVHIPTDTMMAVKRIRATPDQAENKLLMEYNVAMRSLDCPYTITFYGALFREGDIWICMELMDKSLDKLYNLVYNKFGDVIPEVIVGKMAEATLKALVYLHDQLHVMHRDVKPSNILMNKRGEIKLCDFGIAGELVNSLAKTDIGCRPYLAPERIYHPDGPLQYDHRCDVWSLGITIYELAVGKFPYPPYRNLFEQMKLVLEGPAPSLPDDHQYPEDLRDFVSKCLIKDKDSRPKYSEIIEHNLIKRMEKEDVDVEKWYLEILEREKALNDSEQ